MGPSSRRLAQLLAWAALAGLAALAILVAWLLGFPGVMILGLLLLLVCTRAELSDQVPVWSLAVFHARQQPPASLEARADRAAARRNNRAELRFFKGCCVLLIVAGLLGTAWQFWRNG
jgi:hypothetical protein